jgi:hypothetical protein
MGWTCDWCGQWFRRRPPMQAPKFEGEGAESVIFFAKDRNGLWHSAVQNGEWQLCPSPFEGEPYER